MSGTGIRCTVTALLAALAAYFEQIGVALAVMTAVMVLDYITGMLKAYLCGELCSRRGLTGIMKKLSYLIVVVTGAVCDWILCSALGSVGIAFSMPFPVALLIAIWLIINELISILENLTVIGIPMPKFLMHLVQRLAIAVEEKGNRTDGEGEGQDEGN